MQGLLAGCAPSIAARRRDAGSRVSDVYEDEVGTMFYRAPGQTPRAATLAYLLGFLHLVAAVATGIWLGSEREIGGGILIGVFGFGLWMAIGTAVSLLARIADRSRRRDVLG